MSTFALRKCARKSQPIRIKDAADTFGRDFLAAYAGTAGWFREGWAELGLNGVSPSRFYEVSGGGSLGGPGRDGGNACGRVGSRGCAARVGDGGCELWALHNDG